MSCISILLPAYLRKGLLLQIIHRGEEASSYKTLPFTESTLNHAHTQQAKKISAPGMLKVLSATNKGVKVIKYRAPLAYLCKPSYQQHSSFSFVLEAKLHVIQYI